MMGRHWTGCYMGGARLNRLPEIVDWYVDEENRSRFARHASAEARPDRRRLRDDEARRIDPLGRRALTVAEQHSPPVVPRPAATVLLLREGRADVEVLAIRRHEKLAFMGGMWVFPGGTVCAADDAAAAFARIPPAVPDELRAARHFAGRADRCTRVPRTRCRRLSRDVRRDRCAARERRRWTANATMISLHDLQDHGARLRRNRNLFAEVLRDEIFFCASNGSSTGLTGSRRRVVPRRFDTRFFFAPVPSGSNRRQRQHRNSRSRVAEPRRDVAAA